MADKIDCRAIYLERQAQKKKLDEVLVAIEKLVSSSEDQKTSLWRSFVITACQSMRLAIKVWNLENEVEDML